MEPSIVGGFIANIVRLEVREKLLGDVTQRRIKHATYPLLLNSTELNKHCKHRELYSLKRLGFKSLIVCAVM